MIKTVAIKLFTGTLIGITWAFTMALIGLLAKAGWYALSFGWNLI